MQRPHCLIAAYYMSPPLHGLQYLDREKSAPLGVHTEKDTVSFLFLKCAFNKRTI